MATLREPAPPTLPHLGYPAPLRHPKVHTITELHTAGGKGGWTLTAPPRDPRQPLLGTLASPSFRDRRSTEVSRPSGPPEGHELLREEPWEASCPTLPPRQTQGSQAYGPRPGHDALWPQPPACGPVLFLLLSAVYGLLLKETKPRSGFLQAPALEALMEPLGHVRLGLPFTVGPLLFG